MAGRLRKPAGATVRSRDGQRPVETQQLSVTVPPKPRGMPAAVRRAWDDFWSSDIALLLQSSDLHGVRRLFQLYGEREHCHAAVTDRRVTRVPLAEAVKVGLSGSLVHELDDAGETHSFVEVEHDGRTALTAQGVQQLSPWARDLRVIDAEIRQLEDRFGLNLRERARLAVVARPPAPPEAPAAPSDEDAAADEDSRIIDSF